jgi:tetratricopeptide (TPR) repeat protein
VPYASTVLTSVSSALDDYSRRWTRQRQEACVATRVQRQSSESELALRTTCLEERRREVEALTEVLTQANAKTVEKAVSAVSRLSPLATCADLGALLRQVKPPGSPELAARVAEHRQVLVRSKSLADAGRIEEALKLLIPLVEPVRALGYRPLEAELLAQLGTAQQVFGHFETAEETLRDALAAAEACNHDEVKLRAVATLIWPLADDATKAQEARRWVRWARALTSRVPNSEQALARILFLEGLSIIRENDANRAVPLLREALALTEAKEGPDSSEAARISNLLAGALGLAGHNDEAEALFEKLLQRQTPILGREHPTIGAALANLSGVYMTKGDHARALEAAEEALRIYKLALSPQHPHLARTRSGIAVALLAMGRHSDALPLLEDALRTMEAAVGAKNPELTDQLSSLAIALVEVGRPAEALPHAKRAVALAETLPDEGKLARAMGGVLGQVQLALQQPAQALPLLQAALKQAEADPAKVAPGELPYLRFLVARAAWEARQDRAAALTLARHALAGLEGPGTALYRPRVEAWLAARN